MKPHTIKGRTTSPEESVRLSPSEHVLERIQTLTAELEAVRAEIYGQLTGPAEMPARAILEDRGRAQLLGQFRAALDQIRSALWLCTDEAAANPQRSQRPARAAALSRTGAANGLDGVSSRRQPRETVSFFDRLDRVIDNYMQEGGSLVDPASGKPSKT
jgi:hypothetical protein